MNIKNNYDRQSFQAKFTKSDSLTEIVKYAKEKGKFEKLNQARKNIESAYLTRRIQVDLFYDGERPAIIYTRFEPKYKLDHVATNPEDYEVRARHSFSSTKKGNILDFALRHIIRMGNSVPDNKIFKKVVVDRQPRVEMEKTFEILP